MPCASCAAEVDPNAVVCAHCGAALIPAVPNAVPHPDPPAIVAQQSPQPLAHHSALFAGTLLDADRNLEGLGGWLILSGIGLILSPFVLLVAVAKSNLPLLTDVRYQPYLEKHPAIHGLALFEVATNLCFIAVLGALNYLFFKKKRAFPTYMILYLTFHVVVLLGDTASVHLILPATKVSAQALSNITRTFAAAAIWIPYYLVSRRVKLTFVN